MNTTTRTADSIANGLGIGDSDAAQATRAGVSREFHDFIADVEDLIKDGTSLSGDELASAKSKLGERIASAKESLAAMGDSIAQRARSGARDTNAYVHDKPWQAVGIGAAIGLLLGVVLARR